MSSDGSSQPRTRCDHLRWYVPAAIHEARTYGLRRGWMRFWTSRFWWSGGLFGPVPHGYTKDSWR